MNTTEKRLIFQSKIYIWIIIFGLAISGITAFPIEKEIGYLANLHLFPNRIQIWLTKVNEAVIYTNQQYPFLSYGTDWLAFAHLMLGILFIGVLKDPIKNKWIIQFGIICCVLVIPLALIAGNIRQIPIFWQLIDCSFGIVGIIPLLLCYNNLKKIEIIQFNSVNDNQEFISFI